MSKSYIDMYASISIFLNLKLWIGVFNDMGIKAF